MPQVATSAQPPNTGQCALRDANKTSHSLVSWSMAKQLVDDKLWAILEPLIPPTPPRPKGGRPRIPDRAALTGILFVMKTGIQWEWLPQEMGCGSGMTCWRRLREWQQAGVWRRLQEEILHRLRRADRIDFSRASLDNAFVRAKGGAKKRGGTRPTGASRAASTTCWSSAPASRSRSA
jgi:transposase